MDGFGDGTAFLGVSHHPRFLLFWGPIYLIPRLPSRVLSPCPSCSPTKVVIGGQNSRAKGSSTGIMSKGLYSYMYKYIHVNIG